MRRDVEFGENRVIGLHGFHRFDHAVDDVPQEFDECQLVLGLIDLTAEEGGPTAVFADIINQLERIERRPALPPSTPTIRWGS